MGNTSQKETGKNSLSPKVSPSAIALEELRHLLLAPEQAQLGSLRERLDALKVGAAEVGEVLSEAIRLQSQKNNTLKEALTPIVRDQFNEEFPEAYKRSVVEAPTVITEAISPILVPTLTKEFQKEFPETFLQAVKENPNALAAAVSPILMPIIQDWVKSRIEEMVQKVHQSKIGELVEKINETLENQSPIQRLKWRWQAISTGRSYDDIRIEYLFAHFEVKHVFLIHTKTGILLSRASAMGEGELRENIKASMLSGIKKMCEDFDKNPEQDSSYQLESFKLTSKSKLTSKRTFVEMGSHALLAVVIKNYPPGDWKEKIKAILSEIHVKFESLLEEFNGNMDGFEKTTPLLEQIVVSSRSPTTELIQDKKISKKWIAVAGIILLGCWVGIGIYNAYLWDNFVGFVEDLDKKEAGLFITSVKKNEENNVLIKGFRDPTFEMTALEERLKNIGQETGIRPESLDLDFTPFFPLSSVYILQLAHALLSPPDSVSLLVTENGTLHVSGVASNTWIKEFHAREQYIPGISKVMEEKLQNQEKLELLELISTIESFQVSFPQGRDTLHTDSKSHVEALSQDIIRLDEIAQESEERIILEIHGHASQDGSNSINELVSLRRAQSLNNALNLKGLKNIVIQISAKGTQVPIEFGIERKEKDLSKNRRVSLHILSQGHEQKLE